MTKKIKTYPNPNIHAAFSLVEMLMALLVASLLLAALAPVMTRKMTEVTYKEDVEITDGKAIYNSPGEYTFIVPDGIHELQIQASAGGGGGGGANMTSFKKQYTGTKTSDTLGNSSVGPDTTSLYVQKGWYGLDFELIGFGAPGGYGAGRKLTTGDNVLCETDPQSPSDVITKFKRIPNAADSGRDLCYVPIYLTAEHIITSRYYNIVDASEFSNHTRTCWVGNTANGKTISGSYNANARPVCTPSAACSSYIINRYNSNFASKKLRKITSSEMKRIINMSNKSSTINYLGVGYLDISCYTCNNSFYSRTGDRAGCLGTYNCRPSTIPLQNGSFLLTSLADALSDDETVIAKSFSATIEQGEPKCVYEVMDWEPHTGAGGPSGNKAVGSYATRLFTSATADDINRRFEVGLMRMAKVTSPGSSTTISYGGNGSYLAYLMDNRTLSGASIGATASRKNSNATSETNGIQVEQGYIGYQGSGSKNYLSYIITNANDNDIRNENYGAAGTDTQGGMGAGGALGGITGADTKEEATGKDATKPGYGGGGGACYKNARATADCSPGGKGGPSQATLTFKLAAAGSGGGAGGAVGGGNYIRIKVNPKDIVSIKVGKGGVGGGISANGYDGEDTIITIRRNSTDKQLIFKGGKGGVAGTFESIANTESTVNQDIVSSNVNVGYVLGAKVSEGGAAGTYPDKDANGTDNIYTQIINPLTSTTATDLQKRGGKASADTAGFAGGEGGTTATGSMGGCGGFEVSQPNANGNRRCNLMTENGADAASYSATANQNGGAGGGGGGFNSETLTPGIGGNGAGGYVVIKWESIEVTP